MNGGGIRRQFFAACRSVWAFAEGASPALFFFASTGLAMATRSAAIRIFALDLVIFCLIVRVAHLGKSSFFTH